MFCISLNFSYLCRVISKNKIKQIRQLELKKFRKAEGLFVAEGPKVVGDLIRAGFTPREVYATQQNKEAFPKATEVTDDELRKLSFLQHPQGVLGVFLIPNNSEGSECKIEYGLYLALDGVQDPGNLGTIIRLADWFGINTIYCSNDTADAWAPKVVQATMGSIARVKVVYTDICQLIDNTTLPVYGTLLDGENIYDKQLDADALIVMGNEGNGLSEEVRKRVTEKLLIPCFHKGNDGPESLNVAIATAITCSEFRRAFSPKG